MNTRIDFLHAQTTMSVSIHQELQLCQIKFVASLHGLTKQKVLALIFASGKDYFVHFSAILSNGFKTLAEGAAVLFKPGQGKKGLQAEDVEVV